eukprot:1067922-Pelagomonas_calceolata.AAC.1
MSPPKSRSNLVCLTMTVRTTCVAPPGHLITIPPEVENTSRQCVQSCLHQIKISLLGSPSKARTTQALSSRVENTGLPEQTRHKIYGMEAIKDNKTNYIRVIDLFNPCKQACKQSRILTEGLILVNLVN